MSKLLDDLKMLVGLIVFGWAILFILTATAAPFLFAIWYFGS